MRRGKSPDRRLGNLGLGEREEDDIRMKTNAWRPSGKRETAGGGEAKKGASSQKVLGGSSWEEQLGNR